ncbi:MAG: 6-phosphogluconate dehydrogenase [Candidatus Nitrosopolaris wilkensis]|nr:MAG: 6-phosphogluconate dehydrogenase [Candidatus Nitrosopolaris wilkensis]
MPEIEKIKKKPDDRQKHIVILGSGFAGIEVLKNLQKKFDSDKNIEITLISKDNFILFTPMLPEVASGMIETRHVVTTVRSFCKHTNFYEANVESVDLSNRKVVITHAIGRQSEPTDWCEHTLKYDYLVIALGSENNFFNMSDIEKHSFTMKNIDDAIILRNHIINILEQAILEEDNDDLRKSLLTFVVVGGGFNGVETVGAINDFVRESIKDYYKNIYMTDVRVILVNTSDKLLEQIDENLGKFALEKLKASGVEFIMNTHVNGATTNSAKLDNGTIIPCHTLIWTAGVTPSKLIANLTCEHDKGHRIIANNYLEVLGYEDVVYALGDCASITDPHTGKPYPPTAQHAIRQGKIVAKNIISAIKGRGNNNKKTKFEYRTRGMMAEIGKRTGVAILFGRIKLHGFLAWWMWRTYYLANLPTGKKKLKVIGDWTSDLFFKPDVAMIKRPDMQSGFDNINKHSNASSSNIKSRESI